MGLAAPWAARTGCLTTAGRAFGSAWAGPPAPAAELDVYVNVM